MNDTRLQRSVRATALGLSTNAVLACAKFVAGVLGHSYALIADAVESFADIASSVIVWRGMVVAEKPADADHPYGHGRAETLAAAAVSVLLLGAAFLIVFESAKEIAQPHHTPAPYTLVVLLGVVLIKEALYRIVGRVGMEVESAAVTADAWHHRSDAITSAAAALGIGIALLGGKGYESADDWAAIFAGVVIAFNGFRLLRPTLGELMDATPEGDVTERAKAIALGVTGVCGVEKCLARKMGYAYLLDMHIEVDGAQTVAEAHRLSHVVKDAIQAQIPRVSEVTIHIEPFHESTRTVPLEQSYRLCREIARRTAKNFYWSFLVMPHAKRDAMCAIYAFMRRSDDIADSAANPAIALEALRAWRAQVEAALAGTDAMEPILPALADTVRQYGIPAKHFHELLDGTEMDQAKTRYETFDELYRYCYHVASCVGLVVLPVFGYDDKRALEPAEACGIAFQLTNILRDVKEDAALGRIYLPREDLKKFGVSEDDIMGNRATPQFLELMRFEAGRAHEFYRKAEPLLGMIHADSRGTLAVMTGIYGGLLRKIEEKNFAVFDEKIRLSTAEKLWIVARNLCT